MPLFQRKKDRADITRHWVGDTRFPLELNLSQHSISGARIGGSIDALMRLGPTEDVEFAANEVYCWYSRGLEVTADGGYITGLRILWAAEEGFKNFPGTCVLRDNQIPLSAESPESDLLCHFGDPYWRDADESEIVLFYEFGTIEWQIELTGAGKLKQMTIASPPLMADCQHRKAYGVTKPWPPASTERIRPRSADSLLKPGS